jgi:hypothetical protein
VSRRGQRAVQQKTEWIGMIAPVFDERQIGMGPGGCGSHSLGVQIKLMLVKLSCTVIHLGTQELALVSKE